MSLFDLFRGFFGVPGGFSRGDGRRDPFFDGITHEDEEDHFEDFRSIPPPEEPGRRRGGGSGHSVRDMMLKTPDSSLHRPPSVKPKHEDPLSVILDPNMHRDPFHHWSPFFRFLDIWSDSLIKSDTDGGMEDGDLDSPVHSGGQDQIITPDASQPKTRSFFQSVTVTKVVKPDGTVEEKRTVRDGQGNEVTTVIRSRDPEGPQDQSGPFVVGGPQSFPDMQDEFSTFKFFRGFRV